MSLCMCGLNSLPTVRLERQNATFAGEEQFRLLRLYAERETAIDRSVLQDLTEPSSAIPLEKQFENEKWFQRLREGWPLRPSSVHGVSELGFKAKYQALDVFSSVEEVVPVLGIMARNLSELELMHGTENPVSLSALETALWTEGLKKARSLLEDCDNRVEAGNLLDSAEMGSLCVKELLGDLNPAHPRLLKDLMGTPDVPSHLSLVCSLFEAYRLKELLLDSMERSRFFSVIYRYQREFLMR